MVIPPGGGKEPGLVTGRLPGGTEECQRIGRQGNGAVFGAFAAVNMDREALAIDVGDLKVQGFMEPKA